MDLAIMVEPEEVLMRRIHQMSQRAYLKENAKTRAILVGVREIELCREIGTYTGLEEPNKKVMRLVNAGELWTGKHGEKASYLDSPKCKLCGVETPTMVDAYRHMFWKCESLKDHRSEIWHFDPAFKPEDLPDFLSCHGIPPALRLDPNQAMWGEKAPSGRGQRRQRHQRSNAS